MTGDTITDILAHMDAVETYLSRFQKSMMYTDRNELIAILGMIEIEINRAKETVYAIDKWPLAQEEEVPYPPPRTTLSPAPKVKKKIQCCSLCGASFDSRLMDAHLEDCRRK